MVAERPATPGQQGSHGVISTESGRGECRPVATVRCVTPGEVDSDRTDLLGDPGIQSGVGDGVRRRPEWSDILAGSWEEEHPGPDLKIILRAGQRTIVDVGLGDAEVVPQCARTLVACQ